jgi:hypothetical protein
MSKPNFQTMTQQELHNYFLAHRDDQEAFYAYEDRLHEEGNWIEIPSVVSHEAIAFLKTIATTHMSTFYS